MENMKNQSIFLRTFIVVIVTEMIFNLFDVKNIVGVEYFITLIADLFFAGMMGLISVAFLHTIKREVSYEMAEKIMKQYSQNISDEDDKIIVRLSRYKSFFMGNVIYDKDRHILYGPYVIINSISKLH